MAVYTEVAEDELDAFIATYDIGQVLSIKGIAEGVENSNFLLHTQAGYFILTLYEKRVDAAELPFFLGLLEHLSAHGVTCPQPVRNRNGEALGRLAERPAAIVTFLDGVSMRRPDARHCGMVGEALGRLHVAGANFGLARPNALSIEGWQPLFRGAENRADEVLPGLAVTLAEELARLGQSWPKDLPSGVIHADLFPDNVFFLAGKLSGLIDFYFACNDFLAYDLAICLNAWCFEADASFNITKGMALINGYERVRALEAREIEALPILARGAAVRFLLTRLVDWLNRPAGALVRPKDPLEYLKKLRFHQQAESARDYGLLRMTKRVVAHTDGACSGNPGPGGWGVILEYGGHEKEMCGGEELTTNNRMELMAAIMALESLTRPCDVDIHTDSQYVKDGVTSWIHGWKRNGWKTAAKKPVKNEDLWKRLDAAGERHNVEWHWVKGHAGHDLNERADELARRGAKPFMKSKKKAAPAAAGG